MFHYQQAYQTTSLIFISISMYFTTELSMNTFSDQHDLESREKRVVNTQETFILISNLPLILP